MYDGYITYFKQHKLQYNESNSLKIYDITKKNVRSMKPVVNVFGNCNTQIQKINDNR